MTDPATCRHDPVARTLDPGGLERARCRRCGCDLRRLPVLRRWYRTGPMG